MRADVMLDLPTRRSTRLLGRALGAVLEVGDVVWLEGELGAGKTFFARGLFRALGVPDEVPVTSPTFGLVHELEGRVSIRHLDLYRLGDDSDLSELGIDEMLTDAIVVLEWGARFRSAIAERGVELALAIPESAAGRTVRIRGLDARGLQIVRGLGARRPLVPGGGAR